MLYTADVKLKGSFKAIDLGQLNINADQVLWNEVFVRMQISDTKGLNNELNLRWNDLDLNLMPNALGELDGGGGLTVKLPVQNEDALKDITFEVQANISGTEQLLFTPVGKTTAVNMESVYPHPRFTGDILPQQSIVKDSGFTATWTSLAHKRHFPQQFRQFDSPDGKTFDIERSAFGLDLFVPVNAYQKTMRSVKYAILCILLTFAAFFLIETINRKSVHPFQYGLIGLALILFYTLLLSFSEYIGFNAAYGVAAFCTIGLIAWFVKGILQSGRLSTILSVLLVLIYGYIFTILQLQDYSLLLGSIGLFVTLAVIMYFSRRLQW
jgi:inner membrane protein